MSWFRRGPSPQPQKTPNTAPTPSYAADYGEDEYASSAYSRGGSLQAPQHYGRGSSPSGYRGNQYDSPDDPNEYSSYSRNATPPSRPTVLQKRAPAGQAPAYPAHEEEDSYISRNSLKDKGRTAPAPADDRLRAELFKGATVQPARRNPAATSTGFGDDEEGEEDLEGIKKATRDTRAETKRVLDQTLATGRQTLETAAHVNKRLAEQGEQLGTTQRHLINAEGYVDRAGDNISDIKTLNRSIFIPAITFNKTAKREAQQAAKVARYEREQAAHRKNQEFVHSQRFGGSSGQMRGRDGPPSDDEGLAPHRGSAHTTASDDEDERDEQYIDQKQNELLSLAMQLKGQVKTMGTTLDVQNRQLTTTARKAGVLSQEIDTKTSRMRHLN